MTYSGCTESTTLLSSLQETHPAGADDEREAAEDPHRYALTWSTDPRGQPLRWRVEQEDPQRTAIRADDERLTLESAAGLTLWLDAPLSGAYRIAFVREVLVAGGPHDRLSDLNQFWAARDPAHSDLFTRHGRLSEYDNLDLYYVGMGGNWNSTTRFRYYNGQGERALLGEYTDADHLLRPNHRYQVVIEVDRHETRFLVDDALYFRAAYPAAPAPGHFGFRTVYSRQAISDFSVTPL
ncbi:MULTISPECIES: DUF6250 domain-containing protein [Brenneria]|uniref:DUF6250 domain-containing protein n=1 Tax=Brenneria nigrifluens DSM 30175 = ATCC 13028 TaxID=1121120 RepID=A0A2U1UQ84_9GAMM|nr:MULTISPECIES: DUF6250 domain-containing protein [Brenneria]EHD23570.1 hypothetical protein BrE312_4251 [Brenneria sp. EniD312]PWC23826.1 hypothetical protein DDT54_11865 [Brenneria nigrifluens DSM 30175 = ATCC 13028]QCR06496.1 hypothetical protein EH206_21510 [Brenneria nigrifluens DSM 30175 = ATCC 13028]